MHSSTDVVCSERDPNLGGNRPRNTASFHNFNILFLSVTSFVCIPFLTEFLCRKFDKNFYSVIVRLSSSNKEGRELVLSVEFRTQVQLIEKDFTVKDLKRYMQNITITAISSEYQSLNLKDQ